MNFRYCLVGAVMSGVACSAQASSVSLVDLGFPEQSVGGFGGYVVQSFTATIENLAGIQVLVGGSNQDQTAKITVGLYSDEGLTNLLAQGTDDVDGNKQVAPRTGSYTDFADIMWSPVALTQDATYYLRFDTSNTLLGFYIFGVSAETDFYSGGQLVEAQDNVPYGNKYTDISSVKVYVDDDFGKPKDDPVNPVPLPAGLPLMMVGLGALGWVRRQR